MSQYDVFELPRVGFAGWFSVDLIDAKSGRVKRHLEFPNLITNGGLDFPINGSPAEQLIYLAVGTGSATPSFSDTVLSAEIARTAAAGGFADTGGYIASPEYNYRRITRVFFESEANGNLTELGFFKLSSGGNLFNRQLFKDNVGVATTITKTSSEQLRITYEIRSYAPLADVTGSITLDGSSYGFMMRPGSLDYQWGNGTLFQPYAGQWNAGPGLTEDDTPLTRVNPSPTESGAGNPASATFGSYAAGQFYQDTTAVYQAGNANFSTGVGGGNLFSVGNGIRLFRVVFTPKIPKTNLQRLTLVTRLSWGRV